MANQLGEEYVATSMENFSILENEREASDSTAKALRAQFKGMMLGNPVLLCKEAGLLTNAHLPRDRKLALFNSELALSASTPNMLLPDELSVAC